MIITKNIDQGSEAWLQLRKGRATASEAKKIITPTGRPSSSRIKYMRKLARECVCDDLLEFQGNKYTDWGNEHEPQARDLFSKLEGFDVEEVGFCTRRDKIIGFSPDGLCLYGDRNADEYVPDKKDFGLEIKCPNPDNHTDYIMTGELPDIYKLQVHWSLAASGLTHWYFMSYFPGLNPFILKVQRDEFTEKVKKVQDEFILEYADEREKVFDAILPSRKLKLEGKFEKDE